MKIKKLICLMCIYTVFNHTYGQNTASVKWMDYVILPLQLSEFNSSLNNRGYLFKPDSIYVYVNSDPSSTEPDSLSAFVSYEYEGNLAKTIDVKYFNDPASNVFAEYTHDSQGRIIEISTYKDVNEILKINYDGNDIVSIKTFYNGNLRNGDSVAIDLTPDAISYTYFNYSAGIWEKDREIKDITSDYRNYTEITFLNGNPITHNVYENVDFHNTYEKSFIRKLQISTGFDSTSFSNYFFLKTPPNTPLRRPIRYARYTVNVSTGERKLVQKRFSSYDNQKINYQIFNFTSGDSTLFESGYLLFNDKDRITEHDLQRSTVDFNGLYFYDDNIDLFTSAEFINNGNISYYKYDFDYNQKNIIKELVYAEVSSAGTFGNRYVFFPSPTLNTTLTTKQFRILYPNPTSNQLVFELPQSELKGSYQVVDTKGSILRSGEVLSNVVDVSTLPSGIYFFRLANNSGLYQSKFVKVN